MDTAGGAPRVAGWGGLRGVAAALLALACRRSPAVPACVPGVTAACACAGDGRGVQTCQRDGTFGACACAASTTGPAVRPPTEPSAAGGLSLGTRRLLGRLSGRLAVTVYWTPGQPAPLSDDEAVLRAKLDEFSAAAHGTLEVRWVPTDGEAGRRQAEESGCHPRRPYSADPGAPPPVEAYRCAAFSYRNVTDRLEYLSPGLERFEYQAGAIVRSLSTPRRTVGFLTGHGEAVPERSFPYLQRVLQDEHINQDTRAIDLAGGTAEVPGDLSGLMIVGPTRRLEARELRRLDDYLMRGGSVAVFAGGVALTGPDLHPTVARAEHGLNAWLGGYGITLDPDVLLDPESTDTVQDTEMGRARVPMFAYLALTARRGAAGPGIDASHPALFQMPRLIPTFVSSLSVDDARVRDGGATYAELARTSEHSVAGRDSSDLDVIELLQRREQVFGGAHRSYLVGATFDGPLRSAFPAGGAETPHATSERPARLLVMGSGSLFDVEKMREIAPLVGGIPTNVTALLDVFDWLARDADLIAARTAP